MVAVSHIVGAGAGLAVAMAVATVQDRVTPKTFITINDVSWNGKAVEFDRTVNRMGEALYSVVVVPDFGAGMPVCTGEKMLQFTEGEANVQTFPFDAFTLTPGCGDRVAETQGDYIIFVSLRPLDRDEIVVARMTINSDQIKGAP